MEEPHPDILRAARRGEAAAVAEIVGTAQPMVWRFIAALERDRETVADLAQETLVKAVRGLDGFRGDSRLGTWILSIARNVVHDHQRRVGRQARLVPQTNGYVEPTVEPVDTAARVDLLRAIADLDEPLRDVFVLVEVNGLRYRDVADVLGIAEGTVKSRMFNARRELIRRLEIREVSER